MVKALPLGLDPWTDIVAVHWPNECPIKLDFVNNKYRVLEDPTRGADHPQRYKTKMVPFLEVVTATNPSAISVDPAAHRENGVGLKLFDINSWMEGDHGYWQYIIVRYINEARESMWKLGYTITIEYDLFDVVAGMKSFGIPGGGTLSGELTAPFQTQLIETTTTYSGDFAYGFFYIQQSIENQGGTIAEQVFTDPGYDRYVYHSPVPPVLGYWEREYSYPYGVVSPTGRDDYYLNDGRLWGYNLGPGQAFNGPYPYSPPYVDLSGWYHIIFDPDTPPWTDGPPWNTANERHIMPTENEWTEPRPFMDAYDSSQHTGGFLSDSSYRVVSGATVTDGSPNEVRNGASSPYGRNRISVTVNATHIAQSINGGPVVKNDVDANATFGRIPRNLDHIQVSDEILQYGWAYIRCIWICPIARTDKELPKLSRVVPLRPWSR